MWAVPRASRLGTASSARPSASSTTLPWRMLVAAMPATWFGAIPARWKAARTALAMTDHSASGSKRVPNGTS